MLRVGNEIPDMKLDAFVENRITELKLSSYRGRWLVLLFYPADFTFVCPTELQEAAELHEQFRAAESEVMSVSTDSAYVHKAWHDASPAIKKVKYPMLADPAGKLCRAFGTYLDDEGVSLRASFIVDPDGILKSAEFHDNSIGRSCAEILRKLQAAKHVRENPDSVCPASWRPGDSDLKPKFDLIGGI